MSKNEYYRLMVQQAVENQIPFRYVLSDVWFSAADNMMFVKRGLARGFVMPIKSNRKVALAWADKQQGRYRRVDELVLEEQAVHEVYLESVDFPLLLVKQGYIPSNLTTAVVRQEYFETGFRAVELDPEIDKSWRAVWSEFKVKL